MIRTHTEPYNGRWISSVYGRQGGLWRNVLPSFPKLHIGMERKPDNAGIHYDTSVRLLVVYKTFVDPEEYDTCHDSHHSPRR